ncbi:MAG: SEC-C metal-binding domain-containing protein, partial [Armatimonadota bacterium]
SPTAPRDDWDLSGLYKSLVQRVPEIGEHFSQDELSRIPPEQLTQRLTEVIREEYNRQRERSLLLHVINMRWMQHLQEMDYLREGIHLRGYAQVNPADEYKREGYRYFEQLVQGIAEDATRALFTLERSRERRRARGVRTGRGAPSEQERVKKPVRVPKQPRRNDPCPCGSGKKYKKCCMPVTAKGG